MSDTTNKECAAGANIVPFVLAMVVCDAVHHDRGTGKWFILGTFSVIKTVGFPAIHPPMWVYTALTDGRGKISLQLRLVDVDEEDDPLVEVNGEIPMDDPRTVREVVFPIPPIQFLAAGEYRFQLFADTEFLMERRIIVVGPAPLIREPDHATDDPEPEDVDHSGEELSE
ncbi:MAG: hypothetical protein WD069_04340 [Planctomycetales bacterium]